MNGLNFGAFPWLSSTFGLVKRDLQRTGQFFVYPNTIEISAESTRESLAAEYLSAMVTTALLTEPHAGWESDARWIDASRVISDSVVRTGGGAGISFTGFGMNFSTGQARQLARILPWETWKSLIANILQAMMKRRRGFVLHLNNIDAVSDMAPEKVEQLFDETRELLLTPGLFTILAASHSFRDEVLADRTRLLDVVTPIADFQNLTPDEFREVIQARYDWAAADGKTVTRPVTDKALVELYSRFDGDMRNTFTVAKAAIIQEQLRGAAPVTLTTEQIVAGLTPRLKKKKVVDTLMAEGRVPSQADLCKKTSLPQPTVSHATRRLAAKRWVRSATEGARSVYSLSGYGSLYQKANQDGLLKK